MQIISWLGVSAQLQIGFILLLRGLFGTWLAPAMVMLAMRLVPVQRGRAAWQKWLWPRMMRWCFGPIFRVVDCDPVPEMDGPCIYAFAPHGVMPLSVYSFSELLPNAILHVSDLLYQVPVTRFLVPFLRGKIAPASRAEVERTIKNGQSLVLVPGGVREALGLGVNELGVYRGHKGFARLAVKHQIPVVPVYAFGETHLMKDAWPGFTRWSYTWFKVPFSCPYFPRWHQPQPVRIKVGPALAAGSSVDELHEKVYSWFDGLVKK